MISVMQVPIVGQESAKVKYVWFTKNLNPVPILKIVTKDFFAIIMYVENG